MIYLLEIDEKVNLVWPAYGGRSPLPPLPWIRHWVLLFVCLAVCFGCVCLKQLQRVASLVAMVLELIACYRENEIVGLCALMRMIKLRFTLKNKWLHNTSNKVVINLYNITDADDSGGSRLKPLAASVNPGRGLAENVNVLWHVTIWTRNSSGDEIAKRDLMIMPDSPVWPPPNCLILSEGVIPLDDLHDFRWVSCRMARL